MTRRLRTGFATLFALAALSPAASADPGGDFAVGSYQVTAPSGFMHVRVSAHSGPVGENPTGSIHVTFASSLLFGGIPGDVKGDVDCLFVINGQANISARLAEPFLGQTHVTLILSDQGPPGPGHGQAPDQDRAFIGFSSTPPIPAFACASTGFMLLGKASGNVVVNDAKVGS
jgi:hypothetical protein